MKIINEEIKKQWVEWYVKGKSLKSIAALSGRHTSTIRKCLLESGVELRYSNRRKYHFDEAYFEYIDSSDKAYWLGFLSADGHLVEDVGITINLKSEDRMHLENMSKAFGSTVSPVFRPKTNSYNINFCSKKMANDLKYKWGFTHNKSKTQTFPNIPEQYYASFIRGVFDGDGWVQYYKRKRGTYYSVEAVIGFSGTLDLVENISGILCDKLGVKKRKIYNQKGLYYIKYTGQQQCKLIAEWLVNKELTCCLLRKSRLIKEIINENLSINNVGNK